ncbi:hypothetical protein ACOME3_004485 [Neoechinorhynchus agilis]
MCSVSILKDCVVLYHPLFVTKALPGFPTIHNLEGDQIHEVCNSINDIEFSIDNDNYRLEVYRLKEGTNILTKRISDVKSNYFDFLNENVSSDLKGVANDIKIAIESTKNCAAINIKVESDYFDVFLKHSDEIKDEFGRRSSTKMKSNVNSEVFAVRKGIYAADNHLNRVLINALHPNKGIVTGRLDQLKHHAKPKKFAREVPLGHIADLYPNLKKSANQDKKRKATQKDAIKSKMIKFGSNE